jgi:hypothetical protein
VHEERANACRLGRWIERWIVAGLHLIAAEVRTAVTPAAGGDEGTL